MQELLIRKLHDYIRENNPDVFVQLQMKRELTVYLKDKVQSVDLLLNELISDGKPTYLIEEVCMDKLTEDLRPSAFLYLSSLVQEEFADAEDQWKRSGVFEFEIINLIEECRIVFEHYGFSEQTLDDKQLKDAVMGAIQEYLDKQTVSVNL